MLTEALTIPRRFNGPPRSGNGGYVCGRLARYLDGPASVRLRVPPPLERALKVEASDDEARMFDGDTLVAQARRIEFELAPPAAPSFAEAQVASKACIGFKRHLLPHCFVCGPQRAEGDGLRIFPGRTADDAVFAAPWVPHASLDDGSGRVAPEFLWAALDCAGAFAVMPEAMQPIILGELCARLDGTWPSASAAWSPHGPSASKAASASPARPCTPRPVLRWRWRVRPGSRYPACREDRSMSRTMRAVICDGFDGPRALRIGEMPEPALAAGKVLVDVHAASVSFMDCLLVSGKYQMKPPTPFVPGTDGAGIVRAVGAGVTRVKPGDRVACSDWTGAYAASDGDARAQGDGVARCGRFRSRLDRAAHLLHGAVRAGAARCGAARRNGLRHRRRGRRRPRRGGLRAPRSARGSSPVSARTTSWRWCGSTAPRRPSTTEPRTCASASRR